MSEVRRRNDRAGLTRAFSFVPGGFTAAGFFDMSPEVVGLYALVGGAGLACIGAAWLEGRLFGGKFAYIGDAVNGLLRFVLPAGYAVLLLRFLNAI